MRKRMLAERFRYRREADDCKASKLARLEHPALCSFWDMLG
jgi:hypothetical protein